MPNKLPTLGAALIALAMLSGCGEEQNPESKTQSLDGAVEQPGQAPNQAMDSNTMGGSDETMPEGTEDEPKPTQ